MKAIRIEFNEVAVDPASSRYLGVVLVSRVSADLPAGHFYRILVKENGWCECTSRANGPGSTRHYTFRTYALAQEHAIKWATRKISEDARAKAKFINQVREARQQEADQLARELVCGVNSMDELIDKWVNHGYRPTLRPDSGWKHQRLAILYDQRAIERGLNVVAFRG